MRAISLNISPKTIIGALALSLFLTTGPRPCSAEMGVERLSRERAKQLGVEIRLKENGPKEAWVELECNVVGELKDFDHVSLEIEEGETLLVGYAPLRETRSASGKIVVGLLANRAYLDRVTLRIVTGKLRDWTGHDLRVRDFLDQETHP